MWQAKLHAKTYCKVTTDRTCPRLSPYNSKVTSEHVLIEWSRRVIYIIVVQLLLTYGPFYKNLTARGPLPIKWCIKQHIHHSMDWQQSKILEFECDFHKRRFIESYYVNSDQSSMNDKSSDMFPDIYRFLINKCWSLLPCLVYGLPTVSVVLLLIQCFIGVLVGCALIVFRRILFTPVSLLL